MHAHHVLLYVRNVTLTNQKNVRENEENGWLPPPLVSEPFFTLSDGGRRQARLYV